MTTDVIGQLPCPECNTTTDLKSDGRKHTLKCNNCGVLAYYQTQQAKAHIERRLKKQHHSNLQTPPRDNIVTLQLPEASDAQQRYMLTIEPLGIDPINGQLATFDNSDAANDALTNDEDDIKDEEDKNSPAEARKDKGFFSSLSEYL